VRDTFSHNYLKKLWIWSEIVLDPVYNDHKKYKEKKKLQLWKIEIRDLSPKAIDITDYNWKIVWLALRKLDLENYEQKIIQVIEFLIQKWAKVIILPHSFHKYDEASNDLIFFKNLLLEYYEITDFNLIDNKLKLSHSLDETYNYYREEWLDLILASRLHSIILSKVYKIPYIGLSYSKKTSEQL
jgi:polysaccharide pyruvyl transferase WcaK-like protein